MTAAEDSIRFALGTCCLGALLVATTAKGVCCVLLGDDPNELISDVHRRFPKACLAQDSAELASLISKVAAIVDAPDASPSLPLDVRGTSFQQQVWRALLDIPSGTTATYSDVAEAIGAPQSVRAVASACGANSIAVLIPCHRVVRKGGGLSGYRWGIERKSELLAREARAEHATAE